MVIHFKIKWPKILTLMINFIEILTALRLYSYVSLTTLPQRSNFGGKFMKLLGFVPDPCIRRWVYPRYPQQGLMRTGRFSNVQKWFMRSRVFRRMFCSRYSNGVGRLFQTTFLPSVYPDPTKRVLMSNGSLSVFTRCSDFTLIISSFAIFLSLFSYIFINHLIFHDHLLQPPVRR